MTGGGLHQVRGGAVIERVADVGVAQPTRGYRLGQAGARGGRRHDAVDLHGVEMAAALARAEDRPVGANAAESATSRC